MSNVWKPSSMSWPMTLAHSLTEPVSCPPASCQRPVTMRSISRVPIFVRSMLDREKGDEVVVEWMIVARSLFALRSASVFGLVRVALPAKAESRREKTLEITRASADEHFPESPPSHSSWGMTRHHCPVEYLQSISAISSKRRSKADGQRRVVQVRLCIPGLLKASSPAWSSGR